MLRVLLKVCVDMVIIFEEFQDLQLFSDDL